MSFWESAGGGAAIGAGSGLIGGMYAPIYSKAASNTARSNWRKSLQRGPTYWRQGMERAGFNPILALGRGPQFATAQGFQQQANVPGRGFDTAGVVQGISAAREAKVASEQIKLMKDQRSKAVAEADLAEQMALRATSEANLNAARQFILGPEMHRATGLQSYLSSAQGQKELYYLGRAGVLGEIGKNVPFQAAGLGVMDLDEEISSGDLEQRAREVFRRVERWWDENRGPLRGGSWNFSGKRKKR